MGKLRPAGMALSLVVILTALPAAAEEDVRKVQSVQPELKVIEEKCLVCHNRERINQAVKEQKEKEKILQRMEKKGAVLTDAERLVMGHFWQQEPFRHTKGGDLQQEKKEPSPPK